MCRYVIGIETIRKLKFEFCNGSFILTELSLLNFEKKNEIFSIHTLNFCLDACIGLKLQV
jgi:hypothetical protein